MFSCLAKLLGGRTAVQQRRGDPVLRAAIQQSALVYGEIPLKDLIDEQRREALARQIFLEIDRICSNRNPSTACRDRFAAVTLKLASFQVLVIAPEPEEDLSGLRGQPGITGELESHVSDLFHKNDELRSALFSDSAGEGGRNPREFVLRTYWETYWLLETIDAARIGFGDSIPDNDWKKAFLHAACVHWEHVYRWQLELPSAFEESVAKDAATSYSMFTDIVMSGSKDPATEWRDYYRNSGIPMPFFDRPLPDENE